MRENARDIEKYGTLFGGRGAQVSSKQRDSDRIGRSNTIYLSSKNLFQCTLKVVYPRA